MKKGTLELGNELFRGLRSASSVATAALFAAGVITMAPGEVRADEGGVSFWLPGQFGSLAAAPGVPGWTLGLVNYYPSVSASGAVAAAREVTLGKFNG
ncbi:MAG: phenol degradation protein meta, partial [Xanthobacteraceae bacterium]